MHVDPEQDPVREDTGGILDEWRAWAASLEWTPAKTYAATYPHEYVIAGRNGAPPLPEIRRRLEVIEALGVARPFGRRKIPWLYLRPGDGYAYFSGGPIKTSTGINRVPE